MRKLLLLMISLFLLISRPAFGLIVTDNVDRDKFQYEVSYPFATNDLIASTTEGEIAVLGGDSYSDNFAYVIPRDGRLVGMSVAGSVVCTTGGATFDVTINGGVTGLQCVIAPSTRSAVGIEGSAGSQYSYIRQDRADTRVSQGFTDNTGGSPSRYDDVHTFGKATAISAGNRIGVKVSTDSTFSPSLFTDYVIVIYVLQ